VSESLTEERQCRQRQAHSTERGRAGDGNRHATIVATNPSHVGNASAEKARNRAWMVPTSRS
jgi:hypothetical protein